MEAELFGNNVKKKCNFVAIIPARKGSKELKNKNTKILNGHPLIAYSIEAAIKSKYIKEVFVTTDGSKIARISKKYGAKIIRRPKKLANDKIISDFAVLHAIKIIEKNYDFEHVVFLQPTSPLRSKNDLDKAIELYIKKKADCLFSSVEFHATMWKSKNFSVRPYHKSFKIVSSRDKITKNIIDNGSFYITKKKLFKKFKHRLAGKNIISYEMEKWSVFEIDTKNDFKIIKWLITSQGKPKSMLLI